MPQGAGFGSGRGYGRRGGPGKGRGFHSGSPFRAHGFRLTLPRRIIMEVLEEGDEYLSAEEIHSRVNELSGGGIGLATVYRTLQLLEEHGFLHRLESGEGRSRYKLAPGEEERNRKVFICRRCRRSFPGGSLSPDERKVFAPSEEEMKSRYGFQVQSRVMQFFGLCAECAGETGNSQKEEQE